MDYSKCTKVIERILQIKVVEMAEAVGVSVEAEMGEIGGVEEDIVVADEDAHLADPKKAIAFCGEVELACFAPAIGTAHGVYKGEPKLDFERLEKINGAVEVPLVLHGGTGIPDESVRRAISLGINKLNVSTQIKYTYTAAIRGALKELPEEEFDFRKFLGAARNAIVEVVREKIRLTGSSGKA